MDEVLNKKFSLMAKCGSWDNGLLHLFNNPKTDRTTYLIEVDVVWQEYQHPGGWSIHAVRLEKPACFYLGTYQNAWDIINNQPCFPHSYPTQYCIKGVNHPFLPTLMGKKLTTAQFFDLLSGNLPYQQYVPEVLKKDRDLFQYFYGKKWTDVYFTQKEYYDGVKKRHIICLKREYADDKRLWTPGEFERRPMPNDTPQAGYEDYFPRKIPKGMKIKDEPLDPPSKPCLLCGAPNYHWDEFDFCRRDLLEAGYKDYPYND